MKQINTLIDSLNVRYELSTFLCYTDNIFIYQYIDAERDFKLQISIIAPSSDFLQVEKIDDLVNSRDVKFLEIDMIDLGIDGEIVDNAIYRQVDFNLK